ncbi:MAG TPA: OB-fold domain-containing protein [Acidimicrobiales bacterium]|nr:OB-fold domain-containing protein [Acidimicrobiales bacterium]
MSATGPAAGPPRMVGPASPESAPFWEATRERRLVLQWCRECDRPVQYPRAVCPRCMGSALEWREASGAGRIYAATVEHRPETMGASEPYAVVLVDLAEGARLMGNLAGDPAAARVGASVRVTWEPLEDGRHLPLFELDKEAG